MADTDLTTGPDLGKPDRRGLLKSMAALPLFISPAFALRRSAAEPITPELLRAYDNWLFYERLMLVGEEHPGTDLWRAIDHIPQSVGHTFHFPTARDWRDVPLPSTRAALVLSAVGVDLAGVRAAEERNRRWRVGA
jgi:hypothetical protein